ncbi:MAG: type 4a pilus biogenesis protein PilO [Pseudomonadota bacterium]
MDLAALNNIDLNTISTAPLPIRIGAIVILCVAIIGAGYYFDTQDQLVELEKVETREGELRDKFESKQKKAANLEDYKKQLEEMRRTFGALLRQLPSKTEIPSLIVDVSQTGLASGLEIDLFRPESEIKKDFYAEKPIHLKVKGGYHEFGKFASGVAALPRIVTLHNIALNPGKEGSNMTMSATAKIYRYLEDGE